MRDIVVIDRRYDTQADKLNKAKKVKNDEFYTQYSDVEKELEHYDKDKFKDKVIYLPCDRPQSNFVAYFKEHYEDYKYKEIVYTYIAREENEEVFAYRFDGKKETKTKLKGNGAFQSDECIEIMKRADWVITNPPFSVLQIFIRQLKELNKQFLICIPTIALGTDLISEKIINKEYYVGYESLKYFLNENGALDDVNVLWLTTEKVKKSKKVKYELIKYDDYNAFDLGRLEYLEDILEKNKKGFYGVPITILNSYLLYSSNIRPMYIIHPKKKGKAVFARILIEVK